MLPRQRLTRKFSADRPFVALEAEAVAQYPWPFGLEARLCVHLLPFLHYDSMIIIAQQPDRAAFHTQGMWRWLRKMIRIHWL